VSKRPHSPEPWARRERFRHDEGHANKVRDTSPSGFKCIFLVKLFSSFELKSLLLTICFCSFDLKRHFFGIKQRMSSPTGVHAPRRLLQSAVREAVGPNGPANLKRSESSSKRLRSVVSTTVGQWMSSTCLFFRKTLSSSLFL